MPEALPSPLTAAQLDVGAAYPDFCAACVRAGASRIDVIYTPVAVDSERKYGMTYRYLCEHGHEWTCSWSKKGTDMPC